MTSLPSTLSLWLQVRTVLTFFVFLCLIPSNPPFVAVPKGVEFVISHLGEFPICSGPSGTVPSGLHTRCAHSMIHKLNAGEFRSSSSSHSPKYNIMNEFNGLGGVFPVDVGVYYDEKLVAFVEIDGEFHYKFNSRADVGSDDGWNGKLRRKDKLKEACYRHKYPDVPLFRIRSDQCEQLGMDRAGLWKHCPDYDGLVSVYSQGTFQHQERRSIC